MTAVCVAYSMHVLNKQACFVCIEPRRKPLVQLFTRHGQTVQILESCIV